jgi:hypothetical protein
MDAIRYRHRRFLTLDDIRDHPYVGVVAHVDELTPHNRWRPSETTPKLAVIFEDGRGVILEGGTLEAMIGTFGSETDHWVGQCITVSAERVRTAKGGFRERKRVEATSSDQNHGT